MSTSRITKGIILTIIPVFVFFAVGEIMARILFDRVTPPAGRQVLSAMLAPQSSGNEWLIYRSHPYMLYELTPGRGETNKLGYRGDEITAAQPPDKLRILSLGGSTTWGQGASSPGQTWSAQLEQSLQARGAAVQVINGGLSAATSAEIAAHVIHRHLALKPDIVILHVGWNDVTPLMLPDYDPSYRSLRAWKSPPLSMRPGESQWLKSALIRVLYTWWLRNTNLLEFIVLPDVFYKISGKEASAHVAANEPVGFTRNLESIVAMFRSANAKVIFFPVPVANREIFQRVPSPHALRTWDARVAALSKNLKAMHEVGKKLDIPIWELDRNALNLIHFTDHAHTNDKGHAVKADFLAAKLCEHLAEPRHRVSTTCR